MKNSLKIETVEFAYDCVGEGFPCIMIHGNRDCKENFREMAEILAKTVGGKFYMFDLRGHGESSKTAEGYSIDNFVNDVKGMIENLGYKKINYIGHSLGSTIGIRLAGKYPNLINKLVLMSAAASFKVGFQRPEFTKENFQSQLNEANRRATKFFFQEKYPEVQERITKNWLKIEFNVHTEMLKLLHPDLCEDAQKITCDTLLLYGENDISTKVSDGVKLNELIAASTLKVVKDGSHFMFLEVPNVTNQYIGGFLNEKGL